MSEISARRDGNEGYGARDDEKQEKAPTLFCAGASTSARSAGSFQGQPQALLWTAKNAVDAVSTQKGKKGRSLRLCPDTNSKTEDFLT